MRYPLPFKFGIVSDGSRPGYARVFFEEDNIVTDWWPIVRMTSLKDKQSWILNATEHVVCLCDERLEDGVVLGAIHNDEDVPDSGAGPGKFRQVFEDGTVLEYDKGSHEFTGTIKGKATINADSDVKIATLGKATIQAVEVDIVGNVAITGNLSFSGTLAGGSAGAVSFDGSKLTAPNLEGTSDVKVGSVSLKSHTHPGVTTGSGSTGLPV
jgi:phage baseplate assembly protein V